MADEIKALIEDMGKAHNAFQESVKQSLADNGKFQAETTEKMNKILADYDAKKEEADKKYAEMNVKIDNLHADIRQGKGAEGILDEKAKAKREAFLAYVRHGEKPARELAMVQTNDDSLGGYTCPDEMSSKIITTSTQANVMRQLATVETITSANWSILADPNDMTASRVAEGGTRSNTATPEIGKIEINPKTMYCYPKATMESLQDSAWNIVNWLATKAGKAFANLEITEMATGNGVAGARGITAYTTVVDTSWAWGSIGYVITGVAASISTTGADLVNIAGALEDEYKANASWVMNRATLTLYRLLRGGASGANLFLLWTPSLVAGAPDTLNGFPVYTYSGMPDVGAGEYPVAFGDFKQAYTIVDRLGTNIIRDDLTVPGQIKFNIFRRSSGGVVNSEAYKLLTCST